MKKTVPNFSRVSLCLHVAAAVLLVAAITRNLLLRHLRKRPWEMCSGLFIFTCLWPGSA